MEPQLYDHERTLPFFREVNGTLLLQSTARNDGRKKCNLLEKVELAYPSAVDLVTADIKRQTRHASATAIVLPLC